MNRVLKAALTQRMQEASPGLGAIASQHLFGAANKRSGQTPGVPSNMPPQSGDIQQYARRLSRQMFGRGHWGDLNALVTQESGWNPKADNPTSTAYGLFQFLDSTRDNYNLGLNASPYKQVRKGLDYIQDRYKNPTRAWDFHQSHNWY